MSRQAGDECLEKLDAAIEGLAGCLVSQEGPIREMVRRCLVSVGPPSVPALIRLLASSHRQVRWEAAKALGEIGDPRAAVALVDTLGKDHFGIRWLAAEALIGLGKEGLEPLLSALLRNPDSGFLREGAHHVLRVLRDKDPSLREILAPLVDALAAVGGAGEILPLAQVALNTVRGGYEDNWITRHHCAADAT